MKLELFLVTVMTHLKDISSRPVYLGNRNEQSWVIFIICPNGSQADMNKYKNNPHSLPSLEYPVIFLSTFLTAESDFVWGER